MGSQKDELHIESEYCYDRQGIQKLGLAYQVLVPEVYLAPNEMIIKSSTENEYEESGSNLLTCIIRATEG